jgi:hypothetical protein
VLPPSYRAQPQQQQKQVPAGTLGLTCVTKAGACAMSAAGPVGGGCVCPTSSGPATGQIVR